LPDSRFVIEDEQVRGVWSPGLRRLTVGLVMAITLLAFEALSVATILPVISRQLGDLRLYGWVFSAFLLSSLLGIVVGGAICDRRGVALPAAGGLAVFAAGLVVAGAAPDMPVLVVGRVVQGFGSGLLPGAAYVAIGRSYSSASQPRMLAMLSTAWVVPGLLGPGLAAQVATHVGWRWVFLGLLPLVGVAAVVTVPALGAVPGPDGSHEEPVPILQAAAVAGGGCVLLIGLTTANLASGVPLVAAGAALLVHSLRRLTPAGTLSARPGLPATVLTRGLLAFAFFAGDAFVPLTLTSVRHTSTTFAGLTLTGATITWTAGSWLQARLIARLGPRVLIRAGMAIVLLSLAAFPALLSPVTPLWVAPSVWALGGLGIGIAHAPTTLTALGWARRGQEGQASAAVQLTDVLGTGLGTGVAGAAVAAVHQHGGSPRLGLLIAFAAGAVVATLALAVSPRLPSRTSPAPAPA
jgi:MFS family permease